MSREIIIHIMQKYKCCKIVCYQHEHIENLIDILDKLQHFVWLLNHDSQHIYKKKQS